MQVADDVTHPIVIDVAHFCAVGANCRYDLTVGQNFIDVTLNLQKYVKTTEEGCKTKMVMCVCICYLHCIKMGAVNADDDGDYVTVACWCE